LYPDQNIGSENPPPASISVVVPTYQEASNLGPLICRINKAMSSRSNGYEIIVVDDNSRDGTDEVIDHLVSLDSPVRLITRIDERGLSSAVIRGFEASRGEFLVCMDGDLSHQPEAIPRLLDCFADPEVDLALGSRYVSGSTTDEDWGFFRWLNSKVATLLALPFTPVKDPMSGFFAIRRDVFSKASSLLNPVGYKIGLELMVKCKWRKIVEIPIHFADRQSGRSKLTFGERIKYLKHLIRLALFKYLVFARQKFYSF